MKYKIRSMFIPTKGYNYIAFDFSQAETWIVAHLSNEPRMKDALLNSDIHTITASALFITDQSCLHERWIKVGTTRKCESCGAVISDAERYIGKRSNHGNSYRMSPERWAQVINAESGEPPYVSVTLFQAKNYNKRWLDFYPGIKRWWYEIEQQLSSNRTLITPYRRKRVFYSQWGPELFKEATAYVPQSTVADHTFGAVCPDLGIRGGLLGVHSLPDIRKYCRLVHTAHDSIMLECPIGSEKDIVPQVYKQMCRPLVVNGETFTIPVDGEHGNRWGELEPIPKEWLL
jgi:DNA polymerase I-like protein with 3'-5' exonuclease and polymerase domains